MAIEILISKDDKYNIDSGTIERNITSNNGIITLVIYLLQEKPTILRKYSNLTIIASILKMTFETQTNSGSKPNHSNNIATGILHKIMPPIKI